MFRRIEEETLNSPIKQFWCKRCKVATNIIYKDDEGNSYCDQCVDFSEKSISSDLDIEVEEKVEILERVETVDEGNTNHRRHRKGRSVKKERKLF